MKVTLVAAIGKNRELGVAGNLPWHIPSDFKHFKRITLGKTLIMGRKTFESIGKPLPGRKTIVLSRSQTIESEEVLTLESLDKALDYCRAQNQEEVIIAGGGEVYNQALAFANRLAISRVEYEGEADTYFPKWDENQWRLVSSTFWPEEGKSPTWTFELWERIKS